MIKGCDIPYSFYDRHDRLQLLWMLSDHYIGVCTQYLIGLHFMQTKFNIFLLLKKINFKAKPCATHCACDQKFASIWYSGLEQLWQA